MSILGPFYSRAKKIRCQKYGQMGMQLSDLVENILGKEEIARYEQFPLFPPCFQRLLLMRQDEYLWSKELRLFHIERVCRHQLKIC